MLCFLHTFVISSRKGCYNQIKFEIINLTYYYARSIFDFVFFWESMGSVQKELEDNDDYILFCFCGRYSIKCYG